LPTSLYLNKATKVNDLEQFFDSHLSIIEGSGGGRVKQPYYDRLVRAIELMEKGEGDYSERKVEKPKEVEAVEVIDEIHETPVEAIQIPDEIPETPVQELKAEVKKEDDIDFSKVADLETNSAMKPNKGFEDSVEPAPVPKKSMEQAVESIEKKEKEIEKKKAPKKVEPKVDDGQITMF
jgi:Domain of unknown function (DUF6965)